MGQKMILPIVGMLTIVVSMLFFPTVLDTTATILAENLTSYTGLENMVELTPLMVWVGSILIGGVMTGFGLKNVIKKD